MKQFLLLNFFIWLFTCITNAQTWTNVMNGAGSSASDYVLALTVDSSTNDLYIGGTFSTVSGQPYSNLVKWDGATYTNIGADGSVNALAKLNGNLYAAGNFSTIGGTAANRIALFNGSAWQPLGAGINAAAYTFAWYAGRLYAGGGFTGVNGFGTSANHVASWSGTTWSAVGTGGNNGTTATGCCSSGDVNALCVYNGDLYAGGDFTKAGGTSASCIAKWNGTSWSAVGSGINTYVTSLAVYNNELYAGGNFTTAGGVTAHNIAKWNGTSWSAVGSPTVLNNPVWTMQVINGELYVAGSFSGTVSSGTSKYVAKWDGTAWSNVTTGPGTDNLCFAIAGVPTGWVYAGGGFFSADGNSSAIHLARLFVSISLPVELISFEATGVQNFIRLTWKTASETSNSGFELQRSIDGNNFEKVCWLDGQGNTTSTTDYSYDDKNIQPAMLYYYRLRQVDEDGTGKFSEVVAAKATGKSSAELFLTENPVQQSTVISWFVADPGNVHLILSDATGRQLQVLENSNEAAGTHTFLLGRNVFHFPAGIYFISLSTAAETITRKVIFQ